MSVESTERDGEREGATDDEAARLATELGEAIAELSEYRAFEEARTAVEADPELQERIRAFEERREQFAVDRQRGEATQEDVEALRRAQRELHGDPTMSTFLDRRAALQDRLEALNEAISAPLSMDFGGEAGGCCQD